MILLLGSSGYVGNSFQNYLISLGIEFKTVSLKSTSQPQRDILHSAIKATQPRFLINAAGFTGKPNVDASEDQKLRCLEANTLLPGIIAEVATEHHLPWGHVSSGCIFTGSRPDGSGFNEEDVPNFDFRHNNCSFYSGTKALAEEILRKAPQCYIWRLRIPFNEVDSPRNYLSKIMRYERLLDVRNSISHLDDFVRACCECWIKDAPFGIYNITNPGSITTREVAALIEKHRLHQGRTFQFFDNEEEFMQKAAVTPRASCVLDSSKLARHGIHLEPVQERIEQCLRAWRPTSSPLDPRAVLRRTGQIPLTP
jgi:dTDP-4-dehydrorhamnose reductase